MFFVLAKRFNMNQNIPGCFRLPKIYLLSLVISTATVWMMLVTGARQTASGASFTHRLLNILRGGEIILAGQPVKVRIITLLPVISMVTECVISG
jgi:hypothetical protein